jgi:spore coat protein H
MNDANEAITMKFISMTQSLITPVQLQALCFFSAFGLMVTQASAGADRNPGATPGDDLFAPPKVISLIFEIPAAELETMKTGSHVYGRCTVREKGASYVDAGIRYKRNPEKESASGKPDFTVDFTEFVSGMKFHGLKRLILLAGRNDPSYLSAPIGLDLFRKAGVPAARFCFATVQLNGRNLGLYVVVEGVDRDFIGRHFQKNNGNLYDEGKHTDVDGKLEKYGGKKDPGQADVDALASAALQSDPARRWEQLQQRLDVDRFLAFAAMEILLWQDDSYSMEAAKFRIYHDPATDRMVFFPKNVERLLAKTDGPMMPQCKGVVARAVLTTPQGRQRYREIMSKLLQTVFIPAKVQAQAQALANVVRPAIGNDSAAAKSFDAGVRQFLEAVAKRAEFATHQLSNASAEARAE